MGQSAPNYQGFTPLQSYALPGQQIVQFNGPIQNGITTSIPTIQAPYSAGTFCSYSSIHFCGCFPCTGGIIVTWKFKQLKKMGHY